MKKTTITADQALAKATAYCSRAERSSQEVRDKLAAWGLTNAEDAEHIIDWLKSERFLDNERFARAYVHDKLAYAGWGRIKIAHGLRQKGIGATLAHDAIADGVDDAAYRQTLAALLGPRLAKMERPLAAADRARLYRFAAGRGFEPDVVAGVVAGLAGEPE